MIKMHRFIMIRRCRKNGAVAYPRGFRARDAELNYRLMKLPGEMKSLSVRARDVPAISLCKNVRDRVNDHARKLNQDDGNPLDEIYTAFIKINARTQRDCNCSA